jgi:hypothetical protein
MGLNVAAVCELCMDWKERIARFEYLINPWEPAGAPRLQLEKTQPQA